ncbi:hypothetical protein [Peribacillus sp. SCS-155]|uniref:hypothetical protein n=1 Tax=Peribacillus sedimenti TaxID=3115297 RepID=UPI0039068FA1
MNYDSGASHVLTAIMKMATGMPLTKYAEKHLFKPLDINKYMWHCDSKGIVIGGFGLPLFAEDMAKLGRLMLQRGNWEGGRIVSESWVVKSTTAYLHTYQIGSMATISGC